MERAFLQLFPVPPHLLLEDQTDSINEWLVRSGLAPAAAGRLAKAVCMDRRFRAADFDSDTLGQVLASLLRGASASGPVVVLFEDLHKAHASALTLFEKTRLHLVACNSEYGSAMRRLVGHHDNGAEIDTCRTRGAGVSAAIPEPQGR
jgi:hypothetical protein